jgi:hypothetical protein
MTTLTFYKFRGETTTTTTKSCPSTKKTENTSLGGRNVPAFPQQGRNIN